MSFKKEVIAAYEYYLFNVKLIHDYVEKSIKYLSNDPSVPAPGSIELSDGEYDQLKRLHNFFEEVLNNQKPGANRSIEISGKIKDLMLAFMKPIQQMKFLNEMTLIYLITFQEAFIKDILKIIFKYHLDCLKSNKQITYKEIFDFCDIKDLSDYIIEKEIDHVGSENLDNILKYFADKFNISLDKFEYWCNVREASFRRNIIVHNKSIINETYFNKVKSGKIGSKIVTDDKYILNVAKEIANFFKYVIDRIMEKFPE